jgi:hypothetical protein
MTEPQAREAPLRAVGCMAWLGGIGLGCESPAMGSDLPHVAPRISDHRAPVSVRHVLRLLDQFGTAIQRAPKRQVGVFYVHIEERRHRLTVDRGANHEKRVADPKLRRPFGLETATGTEDLLDEPDESFRIFYGDSRDEGGPTSRYVLCVCHSSTLGRLTAREMSCPPDLGPSQAKPE